MVGGQLRLGRFVIILGGGHETSFGHFLGYVNARLQVDILNWDAHADVRPLRDRLAHSGSPFRQALEHSSGALRRYSVAGLQPHAVAAAHLDLVRKRGRAVFRDEVTPTVMRELYAQLGNPVVRLLRHGRGGPGLRARRERAVHRRLHSGGMARVCPRQAAGRPTVRSVDLAEFNPVYDRDGQTGRLAALTIWHVLRGFAARP